MNLFTDKSMARPGSGLASQAGQAVAEALLVLAVLLACFTAVIWLGQVANLGIQASLDSRYQAFQLTRTTNAVAQRPNTHDRSTFNFSERTLNGSKVLEQGSVTARQSSLKKMPNEARIGTQNSHAANLREEWMVDDGRIHSTQITVRPFASAGESLAAKPAGAKSAKGFEAAGHSTRSYLNSVLLTIKRQTSILTGAGHSTDDNAASNKAAASGTAWKNVADDSIHLTKNIESRIGVIDRGWNRSEPTYDWIGKWNFLIPEHHLNTFKE